VKAGIVVPVKGGLIDAVSSPVQAHRALICAALSDNESYIKCNETPDEINTTLERLNKQGAKIRYDGSGFEVTPIGIPASGRGFSAAAATHGFAGQNNKGEYRLPGDVAYRSISGLFLTLPILDGDSKIIVEGREEYKPYIDMTINILDMFGVKIERNVNPDIGTSYINAGGQKYRSPGKVKVEGDWTSAAVWLCAAALSGDGVICSNLNRFSDQGDKEIVDIIERFGAVISYRGDSVAVRRSNLRSIRIDASATPDIVPYLAVVAATANGRTVIHNAERVHLYENGMLHKISSTLNAIGADVIENSDGLIIQGKPKLRGGTVSSLGDHKIAMMTAIASGICEDTVAITDAEAVNKSYPDFFDDYEKLGGKILKRN